MAEPARAEPPTDAALVAAWRGGEERAAGELVRRHGAALARFLFSAGADRAELDDLVQEAFFRAFRAIEGYRGEASFRSWLFTIGSNALRDERRRRKGRTVLSLEDHDLPDRDDPAGALEARELEGRLRERIGRLPRLQREVFLLRVQEGADYAAIAQALGTTPGAARVHYHNAVKALKELAE